MWCDHRKLAGPSRYPVRIIEIIWIIKACVFTEMSVLVISIAGYASRNSSKASSKNA